MPDLEHPAVQRMARVAAALDGLLPEVVFIGGSIAPLLHTDSPFRGARPTKDTDGVVASSRYSEVGRLHERLRQLGFRQDPPSRDHIHRWLTPQGDFLDLVPAGQHPGGSGQIWDEIALETSEAIDLGVGSPVRYASAPSFFALKWAAYTDRGKKDPYRSHDLEDILGLVAARPTLVTEIASGRREIRGFVVQEVQELIGSADFEDLLAANLSHAQDPAAVISRVRNHLLEIAGM